MLCDRPDKSIGEVGELFGLVWPLSGEGVCLAFGVLVLEAVLEVAGENFQGMLWA